jgi:hypothetical protein
MNNHNPFAIAILLILSIGGIGVLTSCGQHSIDGRSSFTDGKDSYEDPPSSSSSDDEIYVGGEEWEKEEIEEDEEEEIIEEEVVEEEEDIYEE